ncbi:MAG: hypothetical protein ACE14S_12815 [Candidatus Bathyarchaeia archaeon]
MGGKSKGGTRSTAVSNAIQTTQSILADAVMKGVEDALKTWAFCSIPTIAPAIFAAYAVYKGVSKIFKAFKEYKELAKRMSSEKAAVIETERVATREIAKAVAGEIMDEKIQNSTYALVGSILSRPEMQPIMGDDERFKHMLLATLSQFFVGMVVGGRDSVIDRTSRLIE